MDVYFDDLTITHQRTPVIQTDDYYPFGLAIAGLSGRTENKVENRYLFNSKERQELTDWYDYGARMYMPDLGRWNVVDPLADLYVALTPYNYVANNPPLLIDPDGMEIMNGAEEKRKLYQQQFSALDQAVKGAESKYGKRKKDFSSKQNFKKYKSAKKLRNEAKGNMNYWARESKNTQKMMTDLKTNSPNMYSTLDNLTNEHGEIVDVYMVSSGNVEGPNDGANIMGFDTDSKGDVRPISQFGINTIEVQLSNSPSGNRSTLTVTKHEMGHTYYQGTETSSYRNYLNQNGKLNQKGYDGHAKSDPSGKAAYKFENLADLSTGGLRPLKRKGIR
jgi:RHS repeat-associated protein